MLYARQASRLVALWGDVCKIFWVVLGLHIYFRQQIFKVCFKCIPAFTDIVRQILSRMPWLNTVNNSIPDLKQFTILAWLMLLCCKTRMLSELETINVRLKKMARGHETERPDLDTFDPFCSALLITFPIIWWGIFDPLTHNLQYPDKIKGFLAWVAFSGSSSIFKD